MPRSAAGGRPERQRAERIQPIRVVVFYVRTAAWTKKVVDVAGDGFHAAIGHFESHPLMATHSSGGDPGILEMLAGIVASVAGDDPKGESSRR